MKRASKGMDMRGIAVATAVGGGVILVAAQLLAKPSLPPVARPAGTTAGGTASTASASAPSTGAAPITPIALAGEPPVRELFRPLVTKQAPRSGTPALPGGKPPVLPNTTGTAAVKPSSTQSTPAAEAPAAPPAPSGPRVSDLQMLGVIEMTDGAKVLLKNTPTGESRYVAKGEEAFGFKVEEILATEVSVSREGRSEKVMMSSTIPIEGSGSSSAAAPSGFGGGGFGGGFRGGRDRGDREGRREERRERREGREGGGGSEGSTVVAQIMALPTWSERLKALETQKAQLPPGSYDRLKPFFTQRAASEGK